MNPITISPTAAKEILNIINNKKVPEGYALRVVANGGACAGVNFSLGFDEQKDGDERYDIDGVPVLLAKKEFMHVLGVQIDFLDTPEARGFVFKKD